MFDDGVGRFKCDKKLLFYRREGSELRLLFQFDSMAGIDPSVEPWRAGVQATDVSQVSDTLLSVEYTALRHDVGYRVYEFDFNGVEPVFNEVWAGLAEQYDNPVLLKHDDAFYVENRSTGVFELFERSASGEFEQTTTLPCSREICMATCCFVREGSVHPLVIAVV